jgi:hypothetical protein
MTPSILINGIISNKSITDFADFTLITRILWSKAEDRLKMAYLPEPWELVAALSVTVL